MIGQCAEKFQLLRELETDQAEWESGRLELMRRFEVSAAGASRIVNSFQSRLRRPFCLYWFMNRRLPAEDNRLAASLCTCHSADGLVLTTRKTIQRGALALEYAQRIELRPQFREKTSKAEPGTCQAEMTVSFLNQSWSFRSFWQVLIFQTMFFLAALLSYVVIVGRFLYGTAVFITFIQSPVEVAQAATRRASIGLGLLCYLMGLAVLGRNLLILALKRLRG